jgi:hypothetical protein
VIPAVLRLEIPNNRGTHNRGTLGEFQGADGGLYASKGGPLSAVYDVECHAESESTIYFQIALWEGHEKWLQWLKIAENCEIITAIAILQASHHIYDSYILCPVSEFHAESKSIIYFMISRIEIEERWLQRLKIARLSH